uniref:Uncharacterized protein n=1 Tax=Branchiostoma floridae TaxID=7739 RepID=C3Z137_BRAFL|eukprot:XP_002597724.1 hypothetical protein BRAFLDRAFT_77371 [Branchiostoma floridae]
MKTAILLLVLGLVVADAAVIHVTNGKEKSSGLERSSPCLVGAQCYTSNCGGVLSGSGHALCCCGGQGPSPSGAVITWRQLRTERKYEAEQQGNLPRRSPTIVSGWLRTESGMVALLVS